MLKLPALPGSTTFKCGKEEVVAICTASVLPRSGTEVAAGSGAWNFNFNNGNQNTNDKSNNNRRGARWGFPLGHTSHYLNRLLQEGTPVLLVLENDHYWTRIRERRPTCRFVPLSTPTSLPQPAISRYIRPY